MRLIKTLALTTTAIVTLATSVSANIYAGQLTSYSDQQALQFLVREHARDPSTFEDAHEYILLNRPEILEDYLSRTLNIRNFFLSELSVRETFGIGSIALGIAAVGVAASLAGGGGGDSETGTGPNPGPGTPSPGPSPSPSPNPDP
ncbi:hypothetical protein, partial [uncultured Tateyamaria sp.]|uniref:hypothetical protein n=1 Tax=uncultured Tateyamaria sp. TaxID=455651 RepID=UPI00261615F8